MSDEATVVVGTVIDPSMTDELRVTVIVTGLGDNRQRGISPAASKSSIHEGRRQEGPVDYQQFDRPAVLRRSPNQQQTLSTPIIPRQQTAIQSQDLLADVDYLDIPAFLRRQEEEV